VHRVEAHRRIIAKDLRISEATVKTHLLHIFAKLGVDDRTAAVTAGMEKGVLRLVKRGAWWRESRRARESPLSA
jgi:DNA-binding CsgD family transcriptional regulator